MICLVSSFFKLAHTILIGFICSQLCSSTYFIQHKIIYIELGFTLLIILISKKHFLDIYQLILSLSLSYLLIPNNYKIFTGLFFFKLVYVYNTLTQVSECIYQLTNSTPIKLLSKIIDVINVTFVWYLFLGILMLLYKLWNLTINKQSINEDYQIIYHLIDIASTTGLGKNLKNKNQKLLFTYSIPILCASFTIYIHNLIPIFNDIISIIQGKQNKNIKTQKQIDLKYWDKNETENIVSFIQTVKQRQNQQKQINNILANQWIAVSAYNYQRQIPIITELINGDKSKQIRLKLSSLLKRQYYPKGWLILKKGEISNRLMMIDQGQIKTPKLQKNGFVFNKQGFYNNKASQNNYQTNSFVVIWSISKEQISNQTTIMKNIK